ncbi:MAG: hypothetical protein WC473_06100 [Patescibacteria group bacterium]
MINGLADSVTTSRGVASILDNPIYTALAMTLIIIIIFYFSDSARRGVCAAARVRTAFYIFCSILTVIFIYHRRFAATHSEQSRVSEIQSALANPPTLESADHVPVIPPIYLSPGSAPLPPAR